MNSPFVVQQASAMLARPEVKAAASEEDRIQQLYQITFHRPPDPDEVKLAHKFLQTKPAPTDPPPPAWQYGFGEYDQTGRRVKNFQPLPTFTSYAWQGSTNLPDPKLGWVILNADGGHPGNDLQHAAIRRWRAPQDGLISITGELHHPSEKGDGIHARIVSSRKGSLGDWVSQHNKTATALDKVEVKTGDTIDFVTDCRSSVEFDSFTWAPVIKYNSRSQTADEPQEWNAKTDFAGPIKRKPKPLDPWAKYAQVLLLANELMFVD
jgi:hypothetical protein